MENLLIVDRQPMLRLGLKLLLASHLPTIRLFEANCRYSIRELFSREKFSIIILGFDLDREEIRPADIVTIRNEFPNTKLIVYAGSLPKDKIQPYFELGVCAFLPKSASVEEILTCLQKAARTIVYDNGS